MQAPPNGRGLPSLLKAVGFMRLKSESGQALVEFALVLPLLILIICGIIDFGWIFGNQLLLSNACKEATRVCAINSDLTQNELTAKAEQIVSEQEGALYSNGKINVSVIKNTTAEEVTVTANCNLNTLTPVFSTIFGPTYVISSTTIMRME